MSSEKETLLLPDEIKERLTSLFEDPGLQMALLFGSLASGKAHARSDTDLGFLFDGLADVLDLTDRVSRLLRRDNIDVVDLRRASPLLRYAAALKGMVLYEREPGVFKRFYSLSYRMYVDTRKLRDARDAAINWYLQGEFGR
jgi:uncharacterized protein